MRIGILSDSHGQAETTQRSVAVLRDRGAELLLHLGDIGNEAVIDELVGFNARIVFGNCDWNIPQLAAHARRMEVIVDDPMGILEVDHKLVAFTHGHITRCLKEALDQKVDFLLHGHSHEVRDERYQRIRIINPGALFRAHRYTAALLDPAADCLEIIEIAKS